MGASSHTARLATGSGLKIIGTELLNLVTFITAWPDATLDEMAAFIFIEGGGLYSRQAISQRLAELDITKKVASTEGYQTQHPDVQFRVWGFWNCPPHLGVFQVPRQRLIDVDEFGLTFEKCNRTSGWAVTVHPVRKDGHYQHGMKMTVIFAIEPGDLALPAHVRGSVERPRCWIGCLRAVGTTTNIFRDFCDYVCTDIETNNIPGTDFHRVFIWDNVGKPQLLGAMNRWLVGVSRIQDRIRKSGANKSTTKCQ